MKIAPQLFPRVNQLFENGNRRPGDSMRGFINGLVVPCGMPAFDRDTPLYDVLEKTEHWLRLHYLPVNYKGDL